MIPIKTHVLVLKRTVMGDLYLACIYHQFTTVVPTKSESDVIFCLQLLIKTLSRTLHVS